MLLPLLLSLALQDTLPSLHTLHENDITSITSSFEAHSITVTMKNGAVYLYNWKDWDTEDTNPNTPDKIKKAIHDITITFTKTERMPEFIGGDEAWQKYIMDFCTVHQKEIYKNGPAEVTVQFIVHLKGQVTDIEIIAGPENAKMRALAIQAIREAPLWTPAWQNGRQVVCYHKVKVRLQ